ncbi:MAG: segregation and condensation protein A [Planctomycetaceae bacterium]
MSFVVELPAYRGPLDLLLYLVRRQELGINELSLSRVVDQYLASLELLTQLDLSDVAEFLELASTLVELKSQAVLPKLEPDEEDEVAIDDGSPAELIQRLLDYKQIRDAAEVLDERGQAWQLRFARQTDDLPSRQLDPGSQPIADLQLWDLVSTFGRIMREAGGPPPTQLVYDDTPIHVYMRQIHRQLETQERVMLVDLIAPGAHKSALIGWFLAVLELARHHGAVAEQDEHGDIYIVRGANYGAELNVHEVDNYDTAAIRHSNMPTQMR